MKNKTEDRQEIKWNWTPEYKSFDICADNDDSISLKGVSGSVEINGKMLSLADAQDIAKPKKNSTDGNTASTVEYTLPEVDCRWRWDMIHTDNGLEITATLHNTGSTPLTIGEWNVIHLSKNNGGDFKAGEAPGNVRFLRWKSWDMRVERLSCDEGRHCSENICHMFDPASEQTFLSAFFTMDRMNCCHELNYSPSNGIQEYKATCDFHGIYELQPGQQLASEKLHISFYTNPYKALEDWAGKIYAAKKPVFAELPPVGITCGAWVDAWNETEGGYAEVMLENAHILRDKLKGFDIDIFRVSTFTTLKHGIPGNWMKASERHFSRGFDVFLKELQKLGFKPGLWVAPFWFCGEADGVLEENQKNLLRNNEGEVICRSLNWAGDFMDLIPLSKLHKYFLDATHPKTLEFIKKVFAHYREIGIRFYMLDFLEVPGNTQRNDSSQTPLQAARNILKTIRETTGDDTHLQTAVCSTPAFTGIIDAARVGRDFGEGRPLQGAPLSDWRNTTYILHDRHYANTSYLLQNGATSYFTHRKLYINDLNVLTIDKPIPLEHARIATTIFGLCGTPLMLGDDFRRINEERLRMVKLCMPRTHDMPVPVDLFDNVYPDDYCRYLKLPVETQADSYLLAAVFNMDKTAYDAELDFAKLGLDEGSSYRIYEFWTEEYCGTFAERFKYVIPPDACRLFRISKTRRHPWLLATDMHIQQGAVEVKSLEWDEDAMRLSGTVTRPAGEVGNLFILMPRKMRVINHKGLWLMKELIDMNVIIRKEIRFNKDCESFEIFFEPWEEKYVTARPLMPYATEAEWLEYAEAHRLPGDTRVIE
jgi:hypothetical protein